MKKFVVILIFGMFCNTAAFAEERCTDFIDFNWHYAKYGSKRVNKSKADSAFFTFKSRSDKDIKITRVVLMTNNNKIIKESRFKSFYISAYGKDSASLYGLDKVNLDVVGGGTYGCIFQKKPITKKKKYKFKGKSWSQKMLDKIRGK